MYNREEKIDSKLYLDRHLYALIYYVSLINGYHYQTYNYNPIKYVRNPSSYISNE